MKNLTKYGPWSLVTGASSGIGRAISEELASQGLNLILVARNEIKLTDLASDLKNKYGIETKVIPVDLIKVEEINKVIDQTSSYDIGLLINNAGKEDSGNFTDLAIDDLVDTLTLNTSAPLRLSHHFAQKMIERGKGGIVMMSSIVSFQGVPLIANYAASKAYDLVFGESLAAELEPHNVDVLVATPGFTKTNLGEYDFNGTPMSAMEPEEVAKTIVRSIGKRRIVIPGFINKFLFYSGKFMPRWMNTFSFGLVFRLVLRKKMNKVNLNVVYTS